MPKRPPDQPAVVFACRYRPALFSPTEWWWHWVSMPVMVSFGAYLFMGERYFREPLTFGTGSLVTVFLYWLSVCLFTLVIQWVIRLFPALEQAGVRLLVMLPLVGLVMMGIGGLAVWLFSVVPGTGVRFTWDLVVHLWKFGAFFTASFCLFRNVIYVYAQWQERQSENEQLKRQALQHQYDALKGQINPHFLFNSLNSVSSLIADEPRRAEKLVDELSKVYRYMLQTNQKPLIELGAEVRFIRSYAQLLQARYGAALQLQIDVHPAAESLLLPSLSIQMLLDYICQYNALTMDRPLRIRIETSGSGRLWLRYNRQARTVLVDRQLPGIDALMARYRLLSNEVVLIEETDRQATISLPLFPAHPPPDSARTVQPPDLSIE